MKAPHLKQGEEAEAACCLYLESQGLKLIKKNFNCRLGEIDLVMRDKNTLVFVEVRFRRSQSFGGALESITPAKQNKLRRTAELYLQKHAQHTNARFDVVAMSNKTKPTIDKQPYTFDWISNAF